MPTQDQIQAAINVMNEHGIDFRAPWECTLDDREQERFEALRDAVGAAMGYVSVAQSVGMPIAWMNREHIGAYMAGAPRGLAWASPEQTEFYDVALYASQPSPAATVETKPPLQIAPEIVADLDKEVGELRQLVTKLEAERDARISAESAALADRLEPLQYATGIAFSYREFRMVIDALRAVPDEPQTPSKSDPLYDSRNPNFGRIGGLRCTKCDGDGFINRHANLPDEPCPACSVTRPAPQTVKEPAERCLTCGRSDAEYKNCDWTCNDPWHADAHLRRSPVSRPHGGGE